MTIKSTKNLKVATLKSWCNFKQWKNILFQKLSARDLKKIGIWGKDYDNFGSVELAV